MESIHKSTLQFLKALAKNNNRDWFAENKEVYLAAQANMHNFIDELLVAMRSHDEIDTPSGKKSLYRIYNDVRFSKDKTPYSKYFGFRMGRATKYRRGGYYAHIEPGNSFLACGFFAPNPDDLKRIRQDIDYNYKIWNKILNAKKLQNLGITLTGRGVETAPRGYSINHPAIELLRMKQFILIKYFTDKEVLSPDFIKTISQHYQATRPWLDHMSEVLTTDLNGVSMFND